MANFSKLPNELVIQIWGYVIDPDDVESFALVSKSVYGLAAPFLREHARLKQIWSRIRYPNKKSGSGAAVLLEGMLLNPRIALYVKELQITRWEVDWYDQELPGLSYPRSAMDLFKEAVRSSSLIAPSEMGDWVRDIESVNDNPIMALTVMQLTNLRSFKLSTSFSKLLPYLCKTLEPITKPSQTAIHLGLSAGGSEVKNNYQIDLPRPSTLSNVSDLKLNVPNIEFEQLSRLLRSMRRLQSFIYFGSVDSPVEPYQLCSELLECSRHSLQKLRLLVDIRKEEGLLHAYLGDITHFEVLAELETDFVLLLGSKDQACRKLADVLPISIERVTLYSQVIITAHALEDVVLQMVQSKMKRLPNLKALTFAFLRYDETELITELEEKSAEVGVLLYIS